MKYFKNTGLLVFSFFVCFGCKKAGADSGAKTPPANLVVTAAPSADGTGNVAFKATADNAVSYVFDFGNGDSKTVPSGIVTYQYTFGGTNTYTVNVTATSSSSLSISKSIQVTVTVTPKLVWSDEFDVDGSPDPAKWGYDLGAGGWGNAELEYYTNRSENAAVQGGVLKIKAIKENFSGSPYSSARLLTQNKFACKYGRVEARAKLPAGVGTWPAIWMLGSDVGTTGWPGCGEIDIMEHRGSELNKIFGTLHYPGHSGGNADGSTTMIVNATTEFHIYSLEWSPTAIKIFVDNQLYHVTGNSSGVPFNHEFFLIMNLAMGGTFAGPVDPTLTNAIMEVDYIRVYN